MMQSVPEDGDVPAELNVYDFKGPGIALAMYNVDEVCCRKPYQENTFICFIIF